MKNQHFHSNFVKFPIHLKVLIFVIGFSTLNSYSQNPTATEDYREKIHLHFDKPYYTAGENIWFKAYLVDAKTNQPITLSKVLYVELIDPSNKILDSKILKIKNEGAAGDFELPTDLISGSYRVRAYTNYLRNFDEGYFFRKEIYIHNLRLNDLDSTIAISKRTGKAKKKNETRNEKPDLHFFPEGGDMVNGINNRIAFKAVGSNGRGISISGTIVDIDGVENLKISTAKFGMGMFGFAPKKGKTYQAIIDYQGETYTYELPIALEHGIAMLVSNQKNDFKISLQSSHPKESELFNLVGRQAGEIVFGYEIKGQNLSVPLSVSKENLKQGIIQFTLYDNNNRPVCERLAFVDSNQFEPTVDILPIKRTYKTRELVTIDLSFMNPLEQAIQANSSVAVTDMEVVEPDIYGQNIKSQLLLNSELKGTIEQPNYYFESDDPNRKRLLDLLMMCQGWRRYIWNDTVHDSIQKMPYAIERGFNFTGSVKKFFSSKKITAVDVSLTLINKNSFDHFEIKTGEKGIFQFGDFDIIDSTKVIIQAKNYWKTKNKDQKKKKKSMMSYFIDLDSIKVPEISPELFGITTANDSLFNNYISRSKQNHYNDSLFALSNGSIKLAEVTLKSIKSKLERIKDNKRVLYGKPSYSVDYNDISYVPSMNPLEALQGRVPGLIVNHDKEDNTVTVRFLATISLLGNNNAMILLDGMPIENAIIISADDIDFVDILKRSEAAIYGSRAAGGVIAIHTKDGESQLLRSKLGETVIAKQGILSFVHPGFYQAKEFYAPKYKTEKPEHVKPDHRSTLYWNPTVEIDQQGMARISFYSADISTTYRVALEGLTTEGIPFTKEIFIEVD